MRVVVTGANGFVGREITKMLLARGDTVTGVDTGANQIPLGAKAVSGDLGDRRIRDLALADGIDALIHLATVPGGAAETDPVASRWVNVDAMYDLLLESASKRPGVRVVYASSIAVFGDPLPSHVDDLTPLNPKMIYGGHKAMMEHAVAMFSNRGLIDGVTLRLPGILARPKGPSGLKSAFMSDMFHALKARENFVCPVSAQGRIWAQSVARCAENFLHALTVDTALLPAARAVTMPAQVISMSNLAVEIARQCGTNVGLVEYKPDIALEAAFASQPSLITPAAEKAGFAHDGDVATLVASALATLY